MWLKKNLLFLLVFQGRAYQIKICQAFFKIFFFSKPFKICQILWHPLSILHLYFAETQGRWDDGSEMEEISIDGEQEGPIGKFVGTNGGEMVPSTKRNKPLSQRSKVLL